MTEPVIPPAAKLAAKRAFVRTTAQAYGASITGSLVIAAIGLIRDNSDWLNVVVLVLVALLTPPVAGLAAYFQWLRKGIPDEYEEAAVEQRGGRGLDSDPTE